VESPVVKKALSDAIICRKKYYSSNTAAHVDAHKHRPTRQPSPLQELTLINLAWSDHRPSRQGWLPIGINFLISWNCAMQAFTRGDEVRSCRLPDLCHEVNYGPWRLSEEGITGLREMSSPHGLLSIIQQPLGTKIMSSKAHVVGFFRHKDWRRCATSVIAFSIMARLHYMTPSQLDTFFLIEENGKPIWYNYYLIDWRSYHPMANTFRDFMKEADLEYTKLTHVRKLGIIRAHQMGADRENIILLSKHTTHKVDTSYLPELPYKAMLAASGFDVYRREEYFIPRSYMQVPQNWVVNIFPYIDRWRTQVNQMRGYDKGPSAKSFVNALLPHLAQIILQDGIYLTEMYPNHPYALILAEKMHYTGFGLWATQMRELIRNRELTTKVNVSGDIKYDTIMQSSEKTIHKVISVEHRLDLLHSQIRMLHNMLRQHVMEKNNNQQEANVITPTHNQQEANVITPTHNQQEANVITPIRNQEEANVITPIHLDAMEFRHERDNSTISSNHRTMISVEPRPLQVTNTCVIPTLPPNIHKTVVENVEYWLSNKLWEFEVKKDMPLSQLGWNLPTQLRFCRRRDIAKWVKTVGEKVLETSLSWERDGEVFLHVAKIMDEERGRKTVMKAVNEFMDNSPLSWRIKRVRKK
jgi:hypothetical protein